MFPNYTQPNRLGREGPTSKGVARGTGKGVDTPPPLSDNIN